MIPERYTPHTYALMRIVFGLMFLTYGLQKWGLFSGQAAPLLSWPFGVAGAIELICGVLITLGLATKVAAFLASGEMAVAYFWIHQFGGIQIGQTPGGFPVQNGGIPAVLFCFAFLYIASRGPGIMSVDAARRGGGK
jgi:putative oxidoreductase